MKPSSDKQAVPGDSLIGRNLAGVKIESLLGRGGMAEVYLGHHHALDKPVAIKIISAHLRKDPALMQLLQSEAVALTAMSHPNIVQCLDCNVIQGRPYIIMDLLDGITLESRLAFLKVQGLLPPLHVVDRVVQSAASALDYTHAKGIVHRDVKPANMMLLSPTLPPDQGQPLPQDIRVVLTDFGIAQLLDATDRKDLIVGTPAYMSPEQISGQHVDIRADIYALGVVAYQMLAGELPHPKTSDSRFAFLKKKNRKPPPVIPNTPPAVQQVVEQALAHKPEARFAHAGELAEALNLAITKSTISVHP